MTGLTRNDVKVLSTDAAGWHGDAWHIQVGDDHYVISAVDLPLAELTGRTAETMAFASDANGLVEDHTDLACVFTKDHEECIAELLRLLGSAR